MNSPQPMVDQLFEPYELAAIMERFTRTYAPFDNPKFVEEELAYKRKAQQRVQELLAQPRLDKLIAERQFEDAKTDIKRSCSGTFDGVRNNLLNQYDMRSITNAPEEELVRTLYNLLYGTGSFGPRFETWVDLLARDKPSVWPTATYFLMMHDSSMHIFVKPKPFKKLLNALHSKIEWQTQPTAAKYTDIRRLASALLDELAPLGARDMIDVQSFIWTSSLPLERAT